MQADQISIFDDLSIQNVQFEVISILNGFALGEFQEDAELYDKFLNAIVFIETFYIELKENSGKWPNELARKKLSIALWWQKTLKLDNKQIHSIYSVFEGCTDCPRTLERLLNLPDHTVENPLDYVVVENEPCEDCGCIKYHNSIYMCYDCYQCRESDNTRYARALTRRSQVEKLTRSRHDRNGHIVPNQSKRDRIYAKWAMRLSAERERRKAYQNAQNAL